MFIPKMNIPHPNSKVEQDHFGVQLQKVLIFFIVELNSLHRYFKFYRSNKTFFDKCQLSVNKIVSDSVKYSHLYYLSYKIRKNVLFKRLIRLHSI